VLLSLLLLVIIAGAGFGVWYLIKLLI